MARAALAATRAVGILNFLAAKLPEQFTLSELAARLDINLASAHAILNVLTESGYVIRDPRLRTYGLGPSIVALGSAALESHPLIDEARAEARRLSEQLGLGVAVTAVAGDDIVFLARAGEHTPRGLGSLVGQRVPLEPPIGAVFVAWRDPTKWLSRAADKTALEAVLADVRSLGWVVGVETDTKGPTTADVSVGLPSQLVADIRAVWPSMKSRPRPYRVAGSLDAGHLYDVTMIAAPVFDRFGESLVAITLDGFDPGLSAERIAQYGEQARDAGLVATRRGGGRPPGDLIERWGRPDTSRTTPGRKPKSAAR